MKIAIEAQRIFRPNKHGMDFVALETIRELQKMDHENEYFIFVSPGEDKCLESSDNVHIIELKCPTYPLWEQVALPRAVKSIKPDLLHCTSNTAPLHCPVPLVLTLHDIIYLEKRQSSSLSWYQEMGWHYRRLVVPRILPKCEKIITVSQFERKRILEALHLPEKQLVAVYNGFNSHFHLQPKAPEITRKYKDTENKLNEALQKAQRSDELKSVFLANMSHEIRTPLNAIVGFSTLLACGDADLSRQEIMEFTSLIEKNSQLLMVLISDILDLSKIESNTMEFHFEKVSLNGILESIYSAQKMNLRKGVELLLDLPDRAAVIYTDPTRLGQVVNNLINNAVKFTAEGRITIGYRLKDFATLEVFVEDTGTGMSEEVLAHIFERFYKGDAFVQGTGLGLAICRTIVERFHGKIEVASTLGKGSRFAIVLPQEMRE